MTISEFVKAHPDVFQGRVSAAGHDVARPSFTVVSREVFASLLDEAQCQALLKISEGPQRYPVGDRLTVYGVDIVPEDALVKPEDL